MLHLAYLTCNILLTYLLQCHATHTLITDLDRCGEIDAVELCQHIFPVFVPAYVVRAHDAADATKFTTAVAATTTVAVPAS